MTFDWKIHSLPVVLIGRTNCPILPITFRYDSRLTIRKTCIVQARSQRKDVTEAFHATGKSTGWVECESAVHAALTNQNSESSVVFLPKILKRIPIMLFAGDQDLICNYVGIEALISALTWNGGTGLGKVQTQSWTVNGIPAGTWVTSRNMTYVKVWNVPTVLFVFRESRMTHTDFQRLAYGTLR